MTIDEAIESLNKLKSEGVKSLLIGVWRANVFKMSDDDKWSDMCRSIEGTPYVWDDIIETIFDAVDNENGELEESAEQISRKKMDRRMEMLMSGSQAAEDIILAEDAMEEDAMCCVCKKTLPNYHWQLPNTGMDHGEECYFCAMPTCLECIDHDAPHAIGDDELEGETVCKSCCEKQVKLRDDKDQDDEDNSIAEAEDHPS